MSYPEVMKADKLSYSSPSLANRMIMKSEKQEEEENAAAFRDSNKQHAEKVCSSSPQAIGLSGYYLNGMGMQSIARLGKVIMLPRHFLNRKCIYYYSVSVCIKRRSPRVSSTHLYYSASTVQ